MRIEFTDVFRCPQETLFSWIEDPEKQKQWMDGVVSNEKTGGGEGVGSTFRMVVKEGRKNSEYQGEVTAYDKPNRIEVLMWGGCFSTGMKMRVDYRLSRAEQGTRLDYTGTVEMEKCGWLMRLMFAMLKVFGKWQLKRFMRKLHQCVETPVAKAA